MSDVSKVIPQGHAFLPYLSYCDLHALDVVAFELAAILVDLNDDDLTRADVSRAMAVVMAVRTWRFPGVV